MAPEIIDLTGNDEQHTALSPLQNAASRAEAAASRLQARFQPFSPPTSSRQTLPKTEPATPKRSAPPKLLPLTSGRLSNPSTPTRNSARVLSSDDNIPLSLRKESNAKARDLGLIDPILISSSIRSLLGMDSGLGESLAGSEKSTQEQITAGRISNPPPGNPWEDRSIADDLCGNQSYASDETVHSVNISYQDSKELCTPSEYFRPASLTPSKRKRTDEPVAGSSSQTPCSIPLLHAQKKPGLLSSSVVGRSFDHVNSRKARSITPHIPGPRNHRAIVDSETSPIRPKPDTVVQERAPTDLNLQQGRRPLSDIFTRASSQGHSTSSVPVQGIQKDDRAAHAPPMENKSRAGDWESLSTETKSKNEGSMSASIADKSDIQTGAEKKLEMPDSFHEERTECRKPRIPNPGVLKTSHKSPGAHPPKASIDGSYRTPLERPLSEEPELPSLFGNGEQMEMEFEPSRGPAFPPDYDRGRFPAQRRRRGGKKYETPRVKSFPKTPSNPEPTHRPNCKISRQQAISNTLAIVSSEYPHFRNHPQVVNARASLPSPQLRFPPVSKIALMDGAFAVPDRMTALPPNAFHNGNDSNDTDTMIESGSQLTAHAIARQDLKWSPEEVIKVTQFFASVLYPAIKRQKKFHKYRLSENEFLAVEKSIANDLVNDDLVHFLRRNGFETDKFQRKRIRKQISIAFFGKIATAEQLRLGRVKSLDDFKAEIIWVTFQKKPALSTVSTQNDRESSHKSYETAGPSTLSPNTSFVPILNRSYENTAQRSFPDSARRIISPSTLFTQKEENFLPSRAIKDSSTKTKGERAFVDVHPSWIDGTLPQIDLISSKKPHRFASRAHEHAISYKPEAQIAQGRTAKSAQDTDALTNGSNIAASPQKVYESSAHNPRTAERSNAQGQFDRRKAQPAPPSNFWAKDMAFSSQSRSRSRIFPSTSHDPHLETIIANAALKSLEAVGVPEDRSYAITIDDQVQLLEQQYISKTLIRRTSQGPIQGGTQLATVVARVADPMLRPERQISSLLRHRELGIGVKADVRSELRLRVAERIEPWRRWKGASSDIVTVAWAPNSSVYAVGAAAHTNAEDLQYNRPCNLLFGELSSNKLWELPDHRNQRPKPETFAQGPNSIQETYNACDPIIYQTVNSIAFSSDGTRMYTASRDETVKIWDTSESHHTCIETLEHGAVVSGVDVCRSHQGVFATASQRIENSVHVYYMSENGAVNPNPIQFSASRAEAKRGLRILPECIRWGNTSHTCHYLLAGFTQWDNLGRDDCAREGQLCLWDVNARESMKIMPSSQSVSAAVWHPFLPFFATGGAPGGGMLAKRHSTKTVVRTWDWRLRTRFAMEYESPARDIQDITFHPLDSNIVTAGCTDGTSFVWDYRWPDMPLHRLRHGHALMELDHNRSRAETDTGVCLSAWGSEGSLYYSGSSDGIVKAWDIRRHPADVHIRDVAHIGAAIQNGAFSPDFNHLLVGDADGGIHILSSAPCGPRQSDDSDDDRITEEPISLIRAPDGSGKRLDPLDDNPGTEGIVAAKELIESGQLELHPEFGVGKGANYQGPWSKDKRKEGKEGGIGRLRKRYDKQQVFDRKGNLNEVEAGNRRSFAAMRKSVLDRKFDKAKANAETIENLNVLEASNGATTSPKQLPATRPFPSPRLDEVNEERVKVIERPIPRQEAKGLTKARDFSQSAAYRAIQKAVRKPGASALSSQAIRDPWIGKTNEFFEPDDDYESEDYPEDPQYPVDKVATNDGSQRETGSRDQSGAVDNLIPENEMVEENFWWPRLGEEEIWRASGGILG